MRLLLKILFFPITLVLTLFVAVSRFVCACSGVLLGIVSFLLFTLAVLSLVLMQNVEGAIISGVIAFLISPFGLLRILEWLTDKVEDLNFAMKSI